MRPVFALLLLFSATFSFSQNVADSLKFNNRKYRREVGIDFKGLFSGNPGAGLLLKIRKESGRLIALTYSNNLRFQLNAYGRAPISTKVTYYDTTRIDRFYHQVEKNIFIQPMIGWERNNFFGKINLFYGFDFGPLYRQVEYENFFWGQPSTIIHLKMKKNLAFLLFHFLE